MTLRSLRLLAFLAVSAPQARPLTVLTYQSMQGKGSLGALMQNEFRSACKDCQIKFVTTHESAGLLGKLRSAKRRGAGGVDVVLGISFLRYHEALADKLLARGQLFDRSPYAIIVDTKKIPKKDWPQSWHRLSEKFKGQILIEDPRTSETGFGWLRPAFEMKEVDLAVLKSLTRRTFPSWSSAYSAFLGGEGAAVWSYLTSEAYHRCHDLKQVAAAKAGTGTLEDPRYLALPLDEGYPVHEEWVAPVAGTKHPALQPFMNFVMSRVVQTAIPLTNWMLPANTDVALPECYKGLTELKLFASMPAKPREIRGWIDQWGL